MHVNVCRRHLYCFLLPPMLWNGHASLAFEFKSRSTRFHDNRILRKEPPFIGRFDCDALIVSFPFLRIFHQTLTDLRFSACFKIETFGLLPAHSNLLACLFLRHVSCRLNSGMCFACNFFNVIFKFKIWGKWLRTSLKSNTQFRGEKKINLNNNKLDLFSGFKLPLKC